MCHCDDAKKTEDSTFVVEATNGEVNEGTLACCVGQTGRHFQTCLKEHLQRAGPMKTHLAQCNATLTSDQVDILHSTSRGESFLLTLEALHIRERKPSINTKDEYKSKELVIKL